MAARAVGNLNGTSKSVNRGPGQVAVVIGAGGVYTPSCGGQLQGLVLDILMVIAQVARTRINYRLSLAGRHPDCQCVLLWLPSHSLGMHILK